MQPRALRGNGAAHNETVMNIGDLSLQLGLCGPLVLSRVCRFGWEPRGPTPESVQYCTPQMDFATECSVGINLFECDAFIELRVGCG